MILSGCSTKPKEPSIDIKQQADIIRQLDETPKPKIEKDLMTPCYEDLPLEKYKSSDSREVLTTFNINSNRIKLCYKRQADLINTLKGRGIE